MLKTKLQDAQRIVAISQYNIDHLGKYVSQAVADNCTIIHCGIDRTQYSNPQPRPANTLFQMINVGSLQPYKGQRVLIDACAILRDKGIPFHCRIIGEGENRPLLTKQIAALQLQNHVTLLGAKTQDDVMALLPTADCYIQPSIITPQGKMEGIPVALMEALAACLPVIATNISGIPELVQPNKTGYLVPPENAAVLAEKIAHVHANPEEAAVFAQAGRTLILNDFTIVKNVQKLSDLFDELISTPRVAHQNPS